jgi:2-methylcitrate dehydratase PrpD
VKKIEINSFSWVKTQEVYEMKSPVDAQFCMPYTAAMVFLGHEPGPGWYSDEKLKSIEVAALSAKISVNLDPDIDRAYHQDGEQAARVEITTVRDKKFSALVRIPRGDPRNPLSPSELKAKFKNQANCVLNSEAVDQVIEWIDNLEQLDDISALMTTLKG